ITSSSLVRSSASGWKVTTPLVMPLPPVEVHAIRRSGICSVVVASQLGRDLKTLTTQLLLASSPSAGSLWSTLWTPFMYEGNSLYCVHWLYATDTGTPMLRSSTMLVSFGPLLLPKRNLLTLAPTFLSIAGIAAPAAAFPTDFPSPIFFATSPRNRPPSEESG